jgi:hypothetical protein
MYVAQRITLYNGAVELSVRLALPRAYTFAALSEEKPMEKNLAKISQDEMDKVNVDLAAAGVAFKERYNMPVVADLVEREQPVTSARLVPRTPDRPSAGLRFAVAPAL